MPKPNRVLLLVSLVLLVPVIPFVALGWWLEPSLETWVSGVSSPGVAAAAVTAVLATDIFLPVPSSVVATLAGQQLGVWWGALGEVTAENGWLAPALGVAAALPVLLTFAARYAMRGAAKPPSP